MCSDAHGVWPECSSAVNRDIAGALLHTNRLIFEGGTKFKQARVL